MSASKFAYTAAVNYGNYRSTCFWCQVVGRWMRWQAARKSKARQGSKAAKQRGSKGNQQAGRQHDGHAAGRELGDLRWSMGEWRWTMDDGRWTTLGSCMPTNWISGAADMPRRNMGAQRVDWDGRGHRTEDGERRTFHGDGEWWSAGRSLSPRSWLRITTGLFVTVAPSCLCIVYWASTTTDSGQRTPDSGQRTSVFGQRQRQHRPNDWSRWLWPKGMGECSAFAKHSAEIFILARLFSQGPHSSGCQPFDSHRHTSKGCWLGLPCPFGAAAANSNGWLEFAGNRKEAGVGEGQKLLMRHPHPHPHPLSHPRLWPSPAVLVMAGPAKAKTKG